MKEDRARGRKGRHESVGGDVADEVLSGLVKQFSDPYAFIRELIQNSLDAGSARIDVTMTWEAPGELRVDVRDDGEGMDRAVIEGYLLTLFRSTKEDDLTKIGKFGIGFTSIFAMEPFEVIVDTGRDNVWHRVIFDQHRAWTLVRLPDPYEGTTVTLRLARTRAAATEDAKRVRAAAEQWCRYADATITTGAVGTEQEWPPTVVAAHFTVDAPLVVREDADGFSAVLGPHPDPAPPVGFYNRGITLWEGPGHLPGVTFRVAGRHLEHTLTRDNVIRDEHFERVAVRLAQLAVGQLADKVHSELESAARSGDLPGVLRIFSSIAPAVPWRWRADAPLLPGLGGRAYSLADLRGTRGWMQRLTGGTPTVWWAPPGCPLGTALVASGRPVLVAHDEDAAHVAWAASQLEGVRRAVSSAWVMPTPRSVEGREAEVLATASRLAGAPVLAGEFAGRGEALTDRLAIAREAPWALGESPLPAPDPRHSLVVDLAHPLAARLMGLPPALAAPLLVHAARVSAGLEGPPTATLLRALAAGISEGGAS